MTMTTPTREVEMVRTLRCEIAPHSDGVAYTEERTWSFEDGTSLFNGIIQGKVPVSALLKDCDLSHKMRDFLLKFSFSDSVHNYIREQRELDNPVTDFKDEKILEMLLNDVYEAGDDHLSDNISELQRDLFSYYEGLGDNIHAVDGATVRCGMLISQADAEIGNISELHDRLLDEVPLWKYVLEEMDYHYQELPTS
jgi:hypothetical protein